MKKVFFILLVFALATTKSLNAQIVASIELSDPFVENDISHFTVTDPNNEPYTIQTIIGGEQCREIPETKYGYFNVGSSIANTDNNLILHLSFYDAGTGFFYLQYNAIGNVNYKAITINKSGSNAWVTATIAITDASFRNAQNNGSDFRISGGLTYIKYIGFEKGVLDPNLEPLVNTTASTYSEFSGKSVAGYQAWFRTGTVTSGWNHWSGSTEPSTNNLSFEVYPDVSQYATADLSPTGFANFGNAEPSKLFNSTNKGVIDTHFDWMNTNGIDGVALQRFVNGIGSVIMESNQAHPVLVKNAAEANKKIFYICYDMSSTGIDDTWDDIIMFDWVYNIEQNYDLINSPAYAKVGNKPVVQVWGPGFTSRPGTAQQTIDLINFLKSRGCYVIGGVPSNWRSGTGDSKPFFSTAYNAYDMVSPWSAGRYNGLNAVDNYASTYWASDKAYCDTNGLDYMPCVFPGFAWSNWNGGDPNMIPRLNGEFLWRQAYKIKELGLDQMYIGMFDEYDEGTNIMNGATDYTQIPTDQYFLTQSADGMWLSSDFYLRLTGEATSMLKGSGAAYASFDTPYSVGPVYYRNSFEKRAAETGAIMNLDPCFYNAATVSSIGVSGGSVTNEKDQAHARSGLYTAKITGNATSATSASYHYKIADVKIAVKQNMALSFWKYTGTELGMYTSIDLKFASGKVLSGLSSYVDNNGDIMQPSIAKGTIGAWEQFSCQIGMGELVGDVITEIIIGYDHPITSGTFTAYFDDILIEDSSNPNIPTVNQVTAYGPTDLAPGQSVQVTVDYSITQKSDIKLILQYSGLPGEIADPITVGGVVYNQWEWPINLTEIVEAGTGTLAFNVLVDESYPIMDGQHKWVSWITTEGGGWLTEANQIAAPDYIEPVNIRPTLSMSNSEFKSKPIIYPNPAGDYLNIQLSEVGAIQILSIDGKLLLEAKVTSSDLTTIDISGLDTGLYFIKSVVNKFKPLKIIKK